MNCPHGSNITVACAECAGLSPAVDWKSRAESAEKRAEQAERERDLYHESKNAYRDRMVSHGQEIDSLRQQLSEAQAAVGLLVEALKVAQQGCLSGELGLWAVDQFIKGRASADTVHLAMLTGIQHAQAGLEASTSALSALSATESATGEKLDEACAACEVESASGSDYGRKHTCGEKRDEGE